MPYEIITIIMKCIKKFLNYFLICINISSLQSDLLSVPSFSSTTSTLKDFPITPQSEENWSAFLKKVESSLNIDTQEFINEDSVEKLWSLLETRMKGGHQGSSSTDAEVQVDVKVRCLFSQKVFS